MITLSRVIRKLGPLGLYGLARQVSRHHPRILMYHRFSRAPSRGHVSAAALAQQMAMLARDFHPISLPSLIDTLRAGEAPKPHSIVVTVDDGYADFHDVAWPVMRAHGVPATLFVTTGFVDGDLWLWPDQVTWMLDQLDPLPVTLEAGPISLTPRHVSPWQRDNVWRALIDRLLELPDAQKHETLATLADRLHLAIPTAPPAGFEPVSWQQLRSMQAEGLDVGGHTHTHPTLPRVPADDLHQEIDHCRARLDSELGARRRAFCYPNGQPEDYSAIVRERVEAAGFSGAVVAFADERRHDDLYTLRRHAAADSMFQYRKALSGLEWLGSRRARPGRSAA